MATDKKVHSDLPIPPGDYLAEVLAVKGITQAELARRMGRPVQAVNEIIRGEKAITPATALQVDRALGVPAHIWTGLEARYQLIKARLEEKKQLQSESAYLQQVPYKQLADMDCVERTRDKELKVRELHRFYGVSSLANLPGVKAFEVSFRCGAEKEASSYALAAWLRCAEMHAAEVQTAPFDRKRLKEEIVEIRALSMKEPEEFVPELKGLLAECGIVLVLLPHFPKSYANGAVFWPRRDKAVLVLSIRRKWADIFWFSLFHEIGHLMLHPGKTFIDDERAIADPARKEEEKKADEFAEDSLIAIERLNEFFAKADFSQEAITEFSREAGIAAGIVVGRLQHEGLLKHNSELNRIRSRYEWKDR